MTAEPALSPINLAARVAAASRRALYAFRRIFSVIFLSFGMLMRENKMQIINAV